MKHLTEDVKITIAKNQSFKCANKPGSNLEGLKDFDCPLWKENKGQFALNDYIIDHISNNRINPNDYQNLQALCLSCYKIKYFICDQCHIPSNNCCHEHINKKSSANVKYVRLNLTDCSYCGKLYPQNEIDSHENNCPDKQFSFIRFFLFLFRSCRN